jgi:hypothetical protein
MLKSLLLHVSAETMDVGSGPTSCALGLAKASGANLTAPVFEPDVTARSERLDLPPGVLEIASRKAAALRAAADTAGVEIDVGAERRMSFFDNGRLRPSAP